MKHPSQRAARHPRRLFPRPSTLAGAILALSSRCFLLGLFAVSRHAGAEETNAAPAITVASYYFGQYHPNDPRNEKTKGKGWSEWELVKAAKPRFPGHQQPKVPLWSYQDESDPQVMARKIAAAADHGIAAFIFDWYYYDDGPFLDRTVNEGFSKPPITPGSTSPSCGPITTGRAVCSPTRKGEPRKIIYPGKVSPAGFARIGDHVIKDYFLRDNYWRIDGKPYFSFYDLSALLESFGSVEATRTALDGFRAKARAAGLPGLHLNAVAWGQPVLPGGKQPVDSARLVQDLGFDSVTSYVWVHHAALPHLATAYDAVRDEYSPIGIERSRCSTSPISQTSRWAGIPVRDAISAIPWTTPAIPSPTPSKTIPRIVSEWRC